LDQFPEDGSAILLWNRALLLFRRGHLEAAVAAVRAAESSNRLVRGYLLGVVASPEEGPSFIESSGNSEAAECAQETKHVWQQTPGAIEWLASI
jgi:hypothetical protein